MNEIAAGAAVETTAAGAAREDRQPRILVVEDDPEIQRLLASMLGVRGLVCSRASTVAEARALLAREKPEIILLDVHLPDGEGFSLVDPGGPDDPLVVVVTGSAELETALRALRKGAVDFITKPFTVGDLFSRIDRVTAQWRARERLRAHSQRLETTVRRAADRLSLMERRYECACDEAVKALTAALDLKDHETEEHRLRVAGNAVILGEAMGLDAGQARALRWGAYLHDVGKIGVPERILLRLGQLDGEDRRIMEQHPLMGCRILAAVDFLGGAMDVVRCHHERFDGSGYPQRLAGEAIPLAARIAAVVDCLDEETADRPSHRARPFAEFREQLQGEAGSRFDPRVVEAFLRGNPDGWLLYGRPDTVLERR